METRLRTLRAWRQPERIRMPLLTYVLSVGPALTLALFLVSAYLGPPAPDATAKAATAVTSASILKLEPARAGK